MQSIGLDPLKDIERITFVHDKDRPDDPQFIVQGKFDPAKLSAAIEAAAKEQKENLKIHKTEQGKIYEIAKLDELLKSKLPPAAAGNVSLNGKSFFAVIADKGNLVLVGSKESAETVLAKAAGKKTTKLTNKDLAGLLAKIDPKQTVAIAVPSPDEKVKSITGGVTVTSDVKVDLNVAAIDADTAKTLNGQLAEQLKMAQDIAGLVVLQEKSLAPAVDILNSIKHEAKDNVIGIKSEIKGDTLEKLVKGIAEFAAKNGIK
jgi:hypothetical protein